MWYLVSVQFEHRSHWTLNCRGLSNFVIPVLYLTLTFYSFFNLKLVWISLVLEFDRGSQSAIWILHNISCTADKNFYLIFEHRFSDWYSNLHKPWHILQIVCPWSLSWVELSRIKPLCHKKWLMEAGRDCLLGLDHQWWKSKTQEPPRAAREVARPSRNPERSQSSSSSSSFLFYMNYFQKRTRFILTVYSAI